MVGRATRNFSRLMVEFDRMVGMQGSLAAARWLLPHFARTYQAAGQEIIPPDGPLLVVSNHPAAFDSILISAFIDRPDYKVIVGDVPPYHYLPNLCEHAIFSPPDKETLGRALTVRNAIHHLASGGSLLIFPRGGIEPDPDLMPDPDREFHRWSHSLDIFLKHVPNTQVLVSIVSGVIARAAMSHPLTRLRRNLPDRQRLAFMLQFIRQLLGGSEHYGLAARVTFGEVLAGVDRGCILSEVEQAARRTLSRHQQHFQPPSPA